MCACDECGEDDRSETINSWSDLHSSLNGMWHLLERDLSRTCSPWVLADVRREWYRKQLAELSPETCHRLNRAAAWESFPAE